MSEPRPQRLQLTIAYDGRPFRGWQSQPAGDAVQDHLERAMQQILGLPTRLHGAGRTDAGVHALGQVAHFDVPGGRLPVRVWMRALNDALHPAIRVLAVVETHPGFHARFHAIGKVYTYQIWNESYLHPLEIGRSWMVPGQLDRERLRSAARLLEGEHDFAYFSGKTLPADSSTRTVHEISWVESGPLLTLRFRGNGFLYHMVRMLTGSLIRCATGRAEEQWLLDLLARRTPEKTRYCAPAEGLYLSEVLYPPDAL